MADDNGVKKTSTMPGNERTCPNCGGILTYDPSSRKLHCSLCGKYKEIVNGKKGNVKGVAYKDILNSNRGTPGDKAKLLSCANCGAELIYDSTQVSGTCPFCGSTNLVASALTGSIMSPNGIIPFSIDENGAKESFYKHLNRQLLFPNVKHYVLEKLFPVYLPYISFDSDTVSDYKIEIGYRDSDGGNITYKPCSGSYKRSFSDITVFASSKTKNEQINKIRNIHPSSILPFHPGYMAGYYAERNSMTLKHAFEVAQYDMSDVLNVVIPEHAVREFKGDKYRNLEYKTEYNNTNYKYILAPFYLASFSYKGKKYDVAINGETGGVACEIPFPRKMIITILIILGILAAAFLTFLFFR